MWKQGEHAKLHIDNNLWKCEAAIKKHCATPKYSELFSRPPDSLCQMSEVIVLVFDL